MAQYQRIRNKARENLIVLEKGKWCASPWCHFKGLMLRTSLPADEGLIFVRRSMSVTNTTIHMLFCFFAIGVVWLDADLCVVDCKLAKPWRPLYAPKAPAQYYLEANPPILDVVAEGEQLIFEPH
ncbi:MAG: hypothetical protein GYB66_09345 [Chloroflexi bacterium]|nr:hypothetical protein [Chloroflexota bacterium]